MGRQQCLGTCNDRLETSYDVTEYKRKRALRKHFGVRVVEGKPFRHGNNGYRRINSNALLSIADDSIHPYS